MVIGFLLLDDTCARAADNISIRASAVRVAVLFPHGFQALGGCSDHITFDEPILGYISTSDRQCYNFDGAAGDIVTIRMNRLDGDLDPFVELWGDRGVLVSDDDGGGNRNSLIKNFRLPTNGNYQLVASAYAGASSGRFELTLLRTYSCDTIVFDQPVSNYLQVGKKLCYGFSGSAGELITARMTRLDRLLDPYLELWGEDGLLASDDDNGGDFNSLIAGFRLPTDGYYQLKAQAYGATSGPFELVIRRGSGLSVAVQPPPCVDCGQIIPILTPIPTRVPVECDDPEGCRGGSQANLVHIRGAILTDCSRVSASLCREQGYTASLPTFRRSDSVCLVWSEEGAPGENHVVPLAVSHGRLDSSARVLLLQSSGAGMSRCIRTQLPTAGDTGVYETTIVLGEQRVPLRWRLIE